MDATRENKSGVILIIDDDITNIRVIADHLEEHGFEIIIARDGETGLERAGFSQPDLILLDVMMPGMDGFETCRRLKANAATRDIPVLFATALTETSYKIKGFEAGGVDYVTKPIQKEEVVARVATHLKMRRLQDEVKKYAESLEKLVEKRTEALRKAQNELLVKERLAVLGHFAGSISHELRNPLAAIDSSAYILRLKHEACDDSVRVHLDRISDNVRKSTAIIESLLNLSSMEKPKTKRTDLTDFLPESLRTVKIPPTVETALDLSKPPIFVDIDPEQIRMALKNIIRNAVQAMGESGTLTIAARPSSAGDVEISVADTGPGISEEHIEKVFEPLFSTKTHGIGFGLSITKMIVENHGGTIRAASEPCKGASFIITLPCGA